MKLKILWGLLLLTGAGAPAGAQPRQALHLRLYGLTYHLRVDQPATVYRNRLDASGRTVANPGAALGYELQVARSRWSIRAEQAIYKDCAAQTAGFTHLGFRVLLWERGRHSLLGGAGPTLVYRHDWNSLGGYRDDGYFRQHARWQYRFYWYAPELEYYVRLTSHTQVGLSIVPAFPELLFCGFALRTWLPAASRPAAP